MYTLNKAISMGSVYLQDDRFTSNTSEKMKVKLKTDHLLIQVNPVIVTIVATNYVKLVSSDFRS